MDGLALQRLLPVANQLPTGIFIEILKDVARRAMPTNGDAEEQR
jgi:hypothetical protein